MTKLSTIELIHNLTEKKGKLSSWEESFLESVKLQSKKKDLSDKQTAILQTMFDRNNPSDEWVNEFNNKYKDDILILAKYYSLEQGGTFYTNIQKVLHQADYVPHKDLVLQALNNQYAKRVLRASKNSWRFKESDVVLIRRTVNPSTIRDADGYRVYGYFKDEIMEKPVMITGLHNEWPSQWHVYTCVFLGNPTKEFLIQERFLKGLNRKTKR